MFKPRNTLVAVAEIKEANKKTESGIVVPATTSREYRLCEVIAVGPGMLTHKDEVSPCADLAVGQTVVVKLMHARRIDANTAGLEPIGVDFRTEDGRSITVVEQSQIVAVVADPWITEGA